LTDDRADDLGDQTALYWWLRAASLEWLALRVSLASPSVPKHW
jgi:hypothetical protein